MKTILIIFNGGESKNPPKETKDRIGYQELYTYFKKNGFELCRSPICFYDKKNIFFKEAQFFEDGKWIWKKNIKPNFILDKSRYHLNKEEMENKKIMENKFPFFNSLKLSKLMSDKYLTYKFFKEFSPKSVLIESKNDIKKIKKLKTDEIIIKPLDESGGKGISIVKKDKLLNAKKIISNLPLLAQEFLDLSRVKNDFFKGRHDVRILIRNKTPFYSFARFPKENNYLANISQGGTLKVIPIESLLKNNNVKNFIDNIIDEIDRFDGNKKLYAIDFMFDNDDKIWLIELNSRPGLILEKEEMEYQKEFYEDLLKFFK